MFGPDICQPNVKNLHVILSTCDGANVAFNRQLYPSIDQLTHLYTLILHPNKTFRVWKDLEEIAVGNLFEDFPGILPERWVDDPSVKKPDDWSEVQWMDDPTDLKPKGWVDEAFIPDPDAEKPAAWEETLDGSWDSPLISNPDYMGSWKAKQILDPNYKGPWLPPKIQNPQWFPEIENRIGRWNISYVGFDLWQVTAGSVFDNILITDDLDAAIQDGKWFWERLKEHERKEQRRVLLEQVEALRIKEKAEHEEQMWQREREKQDETQKEHDEL